MVSNEAGKWLFPFFFWNPISVYFSSPSLNFFLLFPSLSLSVSLIDKVWSWASQPVANGYNSFYSSIASKKEIGNREKVIPLHFFFFFLFGSGWLSILIFPFVYSFPESTTKKFFLTFIDLFLKLAEYACNKCFPWRIHFSWAIPRVGFFSPFSECA